MVDTLPHPLTNDKCRHKDAILTINMYMYVSAERDLQSVNT